VIYLDKSFFITSLFDLIYLDYLDFISKQIKSLEEADFLAKMLLSSQSTCAGFFLVIDLPINILCQLIMPTQT